MNFKISNNILVMNPTDEIFTYCENNLVVSNPEYANKLRMGLYMGKTPQKLHMYTKVGNDLILPFGCIDDLNNEIKSHDFIIDFVEAPIEHLSRGEIKLYDYQQQAVSKMVGARNGLLISPTASGKTIMGMHIIGAIGQKALWCCSTRELLNQAMSTYRLIYKVEDGDIGIISEGKIEIGNKITFAIVNTLAKAEISSREFGLVMADEIQYFIKSNVAGAMFGKCIERFRARYKYGLSATRKRADGQEKRIDMLFGNVKHEIPRSAVADKIMNVEFKTMPINTPESFEYLKADGTLDFNLLQGYLADNENRNCLIASMADDLINQGHSVLILCDRIAQIDNIYERMENKKLAVRITGTMTNKKQRLERKQAIDDMRSGVKKCLIATVSLASTGLDIVCLDCLIFASIQKDYTKTVQAVGRISRKRENKPVPVFYSLVDKSIGYCVSAHKLRIRHVKRSGCCGVIKT